MALCGRDEQRCEPPSWPLGSQKFMVVSKRAFKLRQQPAQLFTSGYRLQAFKDIRYLQRHLGRRWVECIAHDCVSNVRFRGEANIVFTRDNRVYRRQDRMFARVARFVSDLATGR
jgi:hypothetical protein